ncbi:putative secreted protein [Actinacidiphila reveromycinica]|uniref:Putative secreted protein n=1 Tax=Actinacidiphila reveromycinica TaxID=659352 RepID=A0A7U3VN32_9ACTN|nr:extracellular solute-binding protein [Streptomyces sp. SN-593]BBA97227.1 putative secreted protein [Streptomyces sp. SN-593]
MRRPGGWTYGVIGLCLVVLAVVGAVVVRAVGDEGSVTLLANWSGQDERLFRQEVIEPFEAKEHIHVLYQGSSAESQVLDADAGAGAPPDVAVLPGPGELADYAATGQLQPLDDLFDAADFNAPWVAKVRGPAGAGAHYYWLPIKTDLKSTVWYPKGMAPERLAAAAARPGSWCLGMVSGATSGWPATDWIEDILLQQAGPDVYQRWAVGKLPWDDARVAHAWRTWGTLVGAGQARYVTPALTRRYDAVSRTAVKGGAACTLEHQSSFIRTDPGWADSAQPARSDARFTHSSALIPGPHASRDSWEVSGDLAAMLHDTPQARKLIRYLARSDVQARWSLSQAGFSADHEVARSVYAGDQVTLAAAKALDAPGTVRCYDASDAMPAVMRDAFELAALRYLADPSSLAHQLTTLEAVRQRRTMVWLPTVCGSGAT